MAKKTKAQLTTDINTVITSNGNQDITGPVLNAILIDIIDSVPVMQIEQGRELVVEGTKSTTITFNTPFESGVEYSLIGQVRDALGNKIDATFDEGQMTITDFKVFPSADGFLTFTAVEDL